MVTKPEALTCSPPKCRLGRASPDERREHILAVAARVFAEDGYGATSMSTIAARLGGSKATLYKYFPSKELLFEAVIQQRCGEVVAPLQAIAEADGDDLEALLVSFGLQFMTALFQPDRRPAARPAGCSQVARLLRRRPDRPAPPAQPLRPDAAHRDWQGRWRSCA